LAGAGALRTTRISRHTGVDTGGRAAHTAGAGTRAATRQHSTGGRCRRRTRPSRGGLTGLAVGQVLGGAGLGGGHRHRLRAARTTTSGARRGPGRGAGPADGRVVAGGRRSRRA
jgi:hypothetical protein